jgi:protein SDA1
MGGSGLATGAGTRVDVTLKLPQLQNLCKRDPEGYREDYDAQTRRLESEVGILALQPNHEPSPRLVELIQFAAAVSSSSYKGHESDRIANMLMNLLVGGGEGNTQTSSNTVTVEERTIVQQQSVQNVSTMPAAALQLHREVRKTCVSALILMRNKGVVEPLRLLELFFRLMAVLPDKALRELLYKHMVNDIRNLNKKGKRDDKVNRAVQSFLHRIVAFHGSDAGNGGAEAATDVAAKRATDLTCELYRRRVWTDDRAVAILASATQSANSTVMCRAMRFFLGIEEKMALDDRRQEEEDWESKNHIDYHSHSKKTKANARHVARQVKNRKKVQVKKENSDWMEADPKKDKGVEASKKLYPAIEMLRDPQGLVEATFKRLRSASSCKYEVKLLMMNFVTRIVGNHELMLLPLYPFLQKYMGGSQRDVTAVLAYCVQACHEQVPPDEVYGILKTIAHNFITERCSEEQMAVGINAARAICARVPSALSVEEGNEILTGGTSMDVEAFARDLAAYSNHRDRSVSIAGKAWTNFIREVHPGLLQGKDRGLLGSALHKNGAKPLRYGEKEVSAGVEGADLLLEYESKKAAYLRKKRDQGDEDYISDEDSVSGEWEEVGENSEDEEPPTLLNMDGESQHDSDAEEDDLNDDGVVDVSKLSKEERNKLKQQASSTRIFSAAEFDKMRKLVERENRAKRDPREAARRKRAIAQGREFEEISDDSDSDEEIHVAGAVNPRDLMAAAKRKRQSKAEKLQKILAGRTKFESKQREGGATNEEKKRKKNFLMSKSSRDARGKTRVKGGLGKKQVEKQTGHVAKKRRRRL